MMLYCVQRSARRRVLFLAIGTLVVVPQSMAQTVPVRPAEVSVGDRGSATIDHRVARLQKQLQEAIKALDPKDANKKRLGEGSGSKQGAGAQVATSPPSQRRTTESDATAQQRSLDSKRALDMFDREIQGIRSRRIDELILKQIR